MNPVAFVKRRPLTTSLLFVTLAGAAVFGLYKMRVDIPSLHTSKLYARFDILALRLTQAIGKARSGSGDGEEAAHEAEHKIVVTSPQVKDVTLTQKYVCQIHSQNHIEVCALEGGYLQKILVKEGQAVKKDDLMFEILPTLFEAKLASKVAEAKLAELEYKYSIELSAKNVVSKNEVLLKNAKWSQVKAEAALAEAELNFTRIKAPFDGIVDRRRVQLGSLIKEGDILTTLSDNSLMWVYFNVPEKDYLEYMAFQGKREENERVELILPGGSTFNQTGKITTIEAKFNNETGNIAFRADFPNPDRLLRHGQTGTVVIHHVLKDAVVIPQRAKFEILAKQYVYVVADEDDKTKGGDHVDKAKGAAHDEKTEGGNHGQKADDADHVAKAKGAAHDEKVDDARKGHGVVRQREIVIQQELDDVFVIEKGLGASDRIILEGIRQVRDGDKVEYEFIAPEKALEHLKFHAE